MNPNQLTENEIVDILAALSEYAEACNQRPDHKYLGTREYWSNTAKRVRSIRERVLHAETIRLDWPESEDE